MSILNFFSARPLGGAWAPWAPPGYATAKVIIVSTVKF